MTVGICSGAARYRAARTLVFHQGDDGVEGYNFLARTGFVCDVDLVTLLGEMRDWKTADQVAAVDAGVSEAALGRLADNAAIVIEDSPEARREERYLSQWQWGLPTAMMHFSADGIDFLAADESERMQTEKARWDPSPDLWLSQDRYPSRMALPEFTMSEAVSKTMLARRTQRDAAGAISIEELSDCLAAGLRITGFTRNCVGVLPLSMTPSGGARNPYEAYVFARNVKGLQPGIYHYGAKDHALATASSEDFDLPGLVGGQGWASGMSAIVMLIAHLRRPMWKYEDGNAYRVMLIEAGHIGQNVALAAAAHGLTACPTAAISHDLVRQQLGLCEVFEAPIYALALARP